MPKSKSSRSWDKANMKTLSITVQIGEAEAIEADAKEIGLSRTAFIKQAVQEKRGGLSPWLSAAEHWPEADTKVLCLTASGDYALGFYDADGAVDNRGLDWRWVHSYDFTPIGDTVNGVVSWRRL